MMMRDDGKRVHRHPDAVAYLEGLGEEGAAMVRPYKAPSEGLFVGLL